MGKFGQDVARNVIANLIANLITAALLFAVAVTLGVFPGLGQFRAWSVLVYVLAVLMIVILVAKSARSGYGMANRDSRLFRSVFLAFVVGATAALAYAVYNVFVAEGPADDDALLDVAFPIMIFVVIVVLSYFRVLRRRRERGEPEPARTRLPGRVRTAGRRVARPRVARPRDVRASSPRLRPPHETYGAVARSPSAREVRRDDRI